MSYQDKELVQSLITFTLGGAFAGMSLLAWLMAFDASSIGTLAGSATDLSAFSTFVLGGSMAKAG